MHGDKDRFAAAVDINDRASIFAAFMEHTPAVSWIKDAEGRYTYASPPHQRLLGRCEKEILGRTDADFFLPWVAQERAARDRELLATGKVVESLEEVPVVEGDLRFWLTIRFPLQLGGRPHVGGVAVDITSTCRAEREIREAEGTFQQILDALTDMVLVKGPHSKLEWANKAFRDVYGMTNEQLKGLIDAPFSEPDHTQQYVKDDLRVFTTGKILEVPEEPIKRFDGKIIIAHTVKCPIFDSEGQVIKTVGVMRDITERHRLELELGQAQKLESVGRLASGVAHEINTPIQFVGDQTAFLQGAFADLKGLVGHYQRFVAKAENGPVSAADIAALRGAEQAIDLEDLLPRLPEAFDAITDGVGRVTRLVQAMKEFGHPGRGIKRMADINRALRNTLTIAANELKYVADVETDLGEIPVVACLISDLNQVFLNLMVNAAHAIEDVVRNTSGRGTITVTTRQEGDHVAISIQDTGGGIPEAIRSKIFDPFFTTKKIGRGTGQGLAIARMVVVEKHQGTLTFETEMSRGTTFHIRIPVAPPDAADAE